MPDLDDIAGAALDIGAELTWWSRTRTWRRVGVALVVLALAIWWFAA